MKKLFLYFTVFALAMTGCRDQIEYIYRINYVYVNECSSEVTMHSVKPIYTGRIDEKRFVIPAKEQLVISLADESYSKPFFWGISSDDEYLIISNGAKTVTQRYANQDELFLEESYTFISENDRRKTVQYVFTDDFFAEGEPIE